MLTQRGYQPSGLTPLDVTKDLRRQLRLQDRFYRIGFSLRRYGVRLLLTDQLSRRLGIDSWQNHVKVERNVIDEATAK